MTVFLNSNQSFPRSLNDGEMKILSKILPQNKSGYKIIAEKIKSLSVIGFGRFGVGNYILGNKNDTPDLGLSSSLIIAGGTIKMPSSKIYAVIHDEEEEKIEFQISLEEGKFSEAEIDNSIVESYSFWNPGDKDPIDQSHVREVKLEFDSITIAVSSSQKRIWLHNLSDGINHLIPVTNFYNELMRIRRNRDPKTALDQNRIFAELDEFSDEELIAAFVEYNKIFKKFDISDTKYNFTGPIKKKTTIFSLFKRK